MCNNKEKCCLMLNGETQCNGDAEWGILSQDRAPDMVTCACDEHLSLLLEPGTSSVWPLHPVAETAGAQT